MAIRDEDMPTREARETLRDRLAIVEKAIAVYREQFAELEAQVRRLTREVGLDD